MNQRSLSQKNKNGNALWGKSSLKSIVDVSLLNSLSNIAVTFDGNKVPSFDELSTLSKSIEFNNPVIPVSNDVDDNDSINTLDRGNRKMIGFGHGSTGACGRSLRYINKRNRNDTQESTEDSEPMTRAAKIMAFYEAVKRHYGDRFAGVSDAFGDTIQRYLKAEISEAAMTSVIKSLFANSPDIIDKFDDIMSSNVVDEDTSESAAMDDYRSDEVSKFSKSKRSRRTTNAKNNNASTADDNQASSIADVDVSIGRESIATFLSKIRSCFDAVLYNEFMDSLIELRSLIRYNHASVHVYEKVQTTKYLIPSIRRDLMQEFDMLFPIEVQHRHRMLHTNAQRSLNNNLAHHDNAMHTAPSYLNMQPQQPLSYSPSSKSQRKQYSSMTANLPQYQKLNIPLKPAYPLQHHHMPINHLSGDPMSNYGANFLDPSGFDVRLPQHTSSSAININHNRLPSQLDHTNHPMHLPIPIDMPPYTDIPGYDMLSSRYPAMNPIIAHEIYGGIMPNQHDGWRHLYIPGLHSAPFVADSNIEDTAAVTQITHVDSSALPIDLTVDSSESKASDVEIQ